MPTADPRDAAPTADPRDDAAPELVTLHVWRVPGRLVPAAVGRTVCDRIGLARFPGLRFAKLLGTSDGATFAARDADLRRWVLLGSWRRASDAAAFDRSRVVRSWRRLAGEEWRAELAPLASHGRWSRRAPFGRPVPRPWDGPVVALTRARLAPRHAVAFWRAVPPVARDLCDRAGLLAAMGIGESPVGLQGTFSLWRTAADLRAFAYQGAAHAAAIRRTSEKGWYAEELFARFGVVRASGSLDGKDPLTCSS